MTTYSPEQNLWDYVLRQAIADVRLDPNPKSKVAKAKHRFRIYKAKSWFRENKRKFRLCDIEGCDPQMGSFLWICEILGLNPAEVRQTVLG